MTDDPNQRPEPASDDDPEELAAPGDTDADADTPEVPDPADESSSPDVDETQATRSGPGRPGSRDAHGRPFSLYLVLGLGVGALLILLAIIYFSSINDNHPEQPICTAIDPASAQQSVLHGDVKRVVVNYDKSIQSSTNPAWGPVLSRIDYTNGECANLPQGIQERNAITLVLGTIYFYNEITSEPQVEIKLVGSNNLSPELFETPTPAPTNTPVPTPTSRVTEAAVTSPVVTTPTPTKPAAVIPPASPIAAGSPGPTATLPATSTPGTLEASAVASPDASPGVPAITATPTP